jgi:hypothetical protein
MSPLTMNGFFPLIGTICRYYLFLVARFGGRLGRILYQFI